MARNEKWLDLALNVKCDAGEKYLPLTDFEELLTACMRARCNFGYKAICLIVGKQSKGAVSGYMDKWLPRLGKRGQDMSILDLHA